MAAIFNAISYQRKLKEAGMESRLAEVQAEEMETILHGDVATKDDISNLKKDMETMETKLRSEMRAIESDLKGFILRSIGAFSALILAWPKIMSWITAM